MVRNRSTDESLARFDAVVDEFLSFIRFEKGLAQNTSDAYRRDLTAWRRFCAGEGVAPLQPDESAVARFLDSLRRGTAPAARRYAPSSVARCLVSLRAFYRFAAREGRIPRDPTVTLGAPKQPRAIPKAIPFEDVEKLLSMPDDSALGTRDRAILETLYGSGMRISELVGLDVDDVDLDGGMVLIKSGKGSKSRVVPLGQASRSIGAYLARARPGLLRIATRSNSGALFLNARGGRLSRQGCWKILKGHARRARLEDRVSPHTLRHSCATHMLDGGADIRVVQELLGHSSLATTQVYTLVSDQRLKEVYLASHPRARG